MTLGVLAAAVRIRYGKNPQRGIVAVLHGRIRLWRTVPPSLAPITDRGTMPVRLAMPLTGRRYASTLDF